jgi:hypothetical protein
MVDLSDLSGSFFTSQKVPGLRVAGSLGVLSAFVAAGALFGSYFGGGMLFPKLVKGDWPLKKSIGLAAMGSVLVGVLAKAAHAFLFRFDFISKNIPHFGLTEIFYLAFFLFVVLVMAFVLPQKFLRKATLSPVQYATTMTICRVIALTIYRACRTEKKYK